MKTIVKDKATMIKKKRKQLTKPIRKWKRRFKFAKASKKAVKLIIMIIGPAMSIFLTVDGFMNKDKKA